MGEVTAQEGENIIRIRARLPKPHLKQEQFIDSIAKRKVIRAGRRGGKTIGISILAVKKFLKGQRVLYAAPTTDQVETFWKACTNSLMELIESGILRKNETEHVIEIPGSERRIRAKTAWNADTLRGDYADLLILDEWQMMNEDAWETVGAPMLLDNNGDAVFIYTPPSLGRRTASRARDPRHAAKLYKKAEADRSGRWGVYHFTSHDNPHLSKDALQEIAQDMTSLALRQEIMAEDIDQIPGALWTLENIDRDRVESSAVPNMIRIVVGVDPTGGVSEAGIVVGGLGEDGHGYLLADGSMYATPNVWGSKAVALYNEWQADRIVAEKNFGGEMVENTILSVEGGRRVALKLVSASRGKIVRAEPIAAKAERGLIHHVGVFPQLEEELCTYVPGNKSPNRMDAMVWVFTELMDGMTLTKGDIRAVHMQQMEAITITDGW